MYQKTWKPTRKWMKAYKSLYGAREEVVVNQPLPIPETVSERKKKAVKPDCPSEQQEQFVAVAWLRRMNIPHHHSPNGGSRDIREAAKFKRLGTSPGFPDLFIPLPRKGRGGLFIELKRRHGGRLSEHQIYWRDLLLANNFAWKEAKGADECIKIVQAYLK